MTDLLLKTVFTVTLLVAVQGGYAPGYNTGAYRPGGYESYAPMPYNFGYNFNDQVSGNQYRQETGNGQGAVTGSYGYTDPYGIYRHVDYVADHAGFRAKIRTNEPGTASKNPADVQIDANPVHGSGYPGRGGGVGHGGGGGGYGGGHHGGYSKGSWKR